MNVDCCTERPFRPFKSLGTSTLLPLLRLLAQQELSAFPAGALHADLPDTSGRVTVWQKERL